MSFENDLESVIGGVLENIPSRGRGGMDVFWNYTLRLAFLFETKNKHMTKICRYFIEEALNII